MKAISESGKFENRQLRQINRCQIYFKATTISDISLYCGMALDPIRTEQITVPFKEHKIKQAQSRKSYIKILENIEGSMSFFDLYRILTDCAIMHGSKSPHP